VGYSQDIKNEAVKEEKQIKLYPKNRKAGLCSHPETALQNTWKYL